MANKNILLIQDVKALGRKGEVVRARPGYIRNYLVPQRYAVMATKQALHLQAKLQEERLQQAMEDKRDAEAVAVHLEGATLMAIVKVDQDGHMYGSVSLLNILHYLKEQLGIEVDKGSIQLKQPIKKTGDHMIPLKLKEGVMAQVKLSVVAEGEEATNSGEQP